MDENFFQTLRQIQKKERDNASLARVGNDFYKQVHSYINKLKRSVGNDPFSDKPYLYLKDSQRIATEICERREHKITDAAVMNIHRSYHLFSKDNPEFDLLDTTPLNLTKEEETLYFSLIDTLKEHRSKISLDKFAGSDDDSLESNRPTIADPFKDGVIEEPIKDRAIDEFDTSNTTSNMSNKLDNSSNNSYNDESLESKDKHFNEISNRLNQIKNAKVIKDEKYEPIEKQITNQNKGSSLYDGISNNSDGLTNSVDLDSNSNLDNSNNNFANNSSNISNSIRNNFNKSSNSNSHSKNRQDNSGIDVNQLYNDNEEFINLDELDKKYEDEYFSQLDEPNVFDVDEFIKPNNRSSPNSDSNSNNKSVSKEVSDSNSNPNDRHSTGYNQEFDSMSNDMQNTESNQEYGSKSGLNIKSADICTVMMCKDTQSIIGVDEKIYGPFHSQDVVVLPKLNADIFLNSNYAKLINI